MGIITQQSLNNVLLGEIYTSVFGGSVAEVYDTVLISPSNQVREL